MAVLRFVSAGALLAALLIHIIGFSTNYWVSADLDSRGIGSVVDANGMSDTGGVDIHIDSGVDLNMGLWVFCLKAMGMSMCPTLKAAHTQDWMKAVQALGILAIASAVAALVFMVYGLLGKGQGDRARLLPYFTAGLCFAAGLILVIAVAMYGAKFSAMMENQLSMMGTTNPELAPLTQNIKEHTGLAWSFALEAISAILMIIAAAVEVFSTMRGCDGSQNHVI